TLLIQADTSLNVQLIRCCHNLLRWRQTSSSQHQRISSVRGRHPTFPHLIFRFDLDLPPCRVPVFDRPELCSEFIVCRVDVDVSLFETFPQRPIPFASGVRETLRIGGSCPGLHVYHIVAKLNQLVDDSCANPDPIYPDLIHTVFPLCLDHTPSGFGGGLHRIITDDPSNRATATTSDRPVGAESGHAHTENRGRSWPKIPFLGCAYPRRLNQNVLGDLRELTENF